MKGFFVCVFCCCCFFGVFPLLVRKASITWCMLLDWLTILACWDTGNFCGGWWQDRRGCSGFQCCAYNLHVTSTSCMPGKCNKHSLWVAHGFLFCCCCYQKVYARQLRCMCLAFLCIVKRTTGNYCAACISLCNHDGNENQLQQDCTLYLPVCIGNRRCLLCHHPRNLNNGEHKFFLKVFL